MTYSAMWDDIQYQDIHTGRVDGRQIWDLLEKQLEDRQDILEHLKYLPMWIKTLNLNGLWKNLDTQLTCALYVSDTLMKVSQSATESHY